MADMTALCARYQEALETIATGDGNDIAPMLAFAALHNQPPVETAVEARIAALDQEVERLERENAALRAALQKAGYDYKGYCRFCEEGWRGRPHTAECWFGAALAREGGTDD